MTSLRRPAVLVGAALCAAAFLLYALTLARDYLPDGIQFAMITEHGTARDVLVANHILYPLLPLLFFRVWELFGWNGGALVPLQVASALGGAAAVGLMYVIARRITGSTAVAAIAAIAGAGFAVSFGVWRYSVDAESVTVPLVFALVVLLTLFPRDSSTGPRPLLTAAATTAAILAHQSQVLLVAVVVVAYLLDARITRAARRRATVLFLGVTGAATVVVHLVVAVWAGGVRSIGARADRLFTLSETGLWGDRGVRGIVDGAQALVSALGGPIAPADRGASGIGTAGFVLMALLLLLPFAAALAVRRELRARHRRTVAVLATWAVLFAAFALYRTAADVSFWTPVLVPWWLFAGLVLGVIAARSRGAARAGFVVAMVAVLAIAGHGWATGILPAQSRSPAYATAEGIAAHTLPGDLIVTTGDDDLYLLTPYVAERRTFSVAHHLLGVQQPPSPWIVEPPRSRDPGTRPTKAAVFADLDREITRTCAGGGHVYLVDSGSQREWDDLAAFGLTRTDFSSLPNRPAWQDADGVQAVQVVRAGCAP